MLFTNVFIFCRLKVGLLNLTVAPENLPSIGHPDVAVVTIGMNGDAFGVFLMYSLSPNATNEGLHLEVREEPAVVVPLVIERRGGNLGTVTVEWRFVGGKATADADFTGTGGTLVFDGMWLTKRQSESVSKCTTAVVLLSRRM